MSGAEQGVKRSRIRDSASMLSMSPGGLSRKRCLLSDRHPLPICVKTIMKESNSLPVLKNKQCLAIRRARK